MATKKKTYDENIPAGFNLSEVLQDAGDSVSISFSSVDGNTFRRFLHCVGELGGMASFYVDSNNQRLCVSVRIGTEKRSYAGETGDLFTQQLEAFIGKVTPALLRLKKSPPPKLE